VHVKQMADRCWALYVCAVQLRLRHSDVKLCRAEREKAALAVSQFTTSVDVLSIPSVTQPCGNKKKKE
jgi:hypothetical protein